MKARFLPLILSVVLLFCSIAALFGCHSKKQPQQFSASQATDKVPPEFLKALNNLTNADSLAYLRKVQTNTEVALQSATNSIPVAREFNKLFPDTKSYVSSFISKSPELLMENLLFERYRLTMHIRFTFDENQRAIRSFGEPDFLLQEISQVTKEQRTGSLGTVEILHPGKNGDRSLRFGAAEWEKIVEAHGDFAAIGFPLLTNSPAPGFEDFRKDWEMRMRKQP